MIEGGVGARLYVALLARVPTSLHPGLRALLSDDERVRCDGFLRADDAAAFLAAHALVRLALSAELDRPPASWRFALGRWGRPRIAAAGAPPRHFSLSHTRGAVAVIVGDRERLAVDVESGTRSADYPALAAHAFHPSEAAAVAACAGDERAHRFYRTWTLKESYIKARSRGLSLPLDGFWFELDTGPPALRTRPGFDREGARWRFEHGVERGFHVAAAVDEASGPVTIERLDAAALLAR